MVDYGTFFSPRNQGILIGCWGMLDESHVFIQQNMKLKTCVMVEGEGWKSSVPQPTHTMQPPSLQPVCSKQLLPASLLAAAWCIPCPHWGASSPYKEVLEVLWGVVRGEKQTPTSLKHSR